jgi:hypothetical protein
MADAAVHAAELNPAAADVGPADETWESSHPVRASVPGPSRHTGAAPPWPYAFAQLGFGNSRDPESGFITNHLGIRGDANAPAAWNWVPGPASSLTITTIPEPSSLALLLLEGSPPLLVVRRRLNARCA